ncbi:hypothetical protein VT930_16890 [Mycobacterium sherrisii]|uniref:hypothetical protein n=1 Tax=Mycobacterium sherrisii TaxID=243061 RepID=UPI002DDD7F1D|nr:hypothetical protein [Mycobacterium sherrisii]MEC4764769.1 hypothetical protein [Mycobacterium sherrisii]
MTPTETADRDRRILELHAQGLSQRAIKAEVGCSLGTVNGVINRHSDSAIVAEVVPLPTPANDGTADVSPETANATATALAVIDAEVVEAELIDTDSTIASIDDETGLGELAAIANHYHQIAEFHQRTSVQAAWCAGQALLKVKGLLPHGDLKRWIEANFWGSYRTAAAYMQIGKSADSAHLGELRSPTSIDSALKAIRASRQPRAQAERKSAEARAINKVEKSVGTIEIAVERLDAALDELRRHGAVAAIRDQAGWIMSAWEQIDSSMSAWIEAADAEAGA